MQNNILNTHTDEDYLMIQCQHFLDVLAEPDAHDDRNALFRTILLSVRERIRADLKAEGRTKYPALLQQTPPGPFLIPGQLDVSQVVWSYQMANYVKSVLEVLKQKSTGVSIGDRFR